MPRSTNHQPLARRLLGHYLMFGLASIVVLSIGGVVIGRSLLHEGDEPELLEKIGEIQSLIVADPDWPDR